MLNTPLKSLRRPSDNQGGDDDANASADRSGDQQMQTDSTQQPADPQVPQATTEEEEALGNATCRLDFYLRVLSPISELMLNERSVHNEGVSPSS